MDALKAEVTPNELSETIDHINRTFEGLGRRDWAARLGNFVIVFKVEVILLKLFHFWPQSWHLGHGTSAELSLFLELVSTERSRIYYRHSS